jgi:type II protein arginine methyltransferase
MVFTTDKIPYPLNFGLDLSRYSDLIISNSIQILPDLISKLDEQNLDYIISPVSLSDRETRINSIKNFTTPIFIDDYSLFAYEWRNKFSSKIHNDDLVNLNEDLIKMDFDYAGHIGAKYTLINLDPFVNSNINCNFFLLNKNLKKFLTENPDKHISLQLPLSEAGLILWEKIQSELNYLENLSLVLEIKPDLPDESVMQKFATHNLKSIILPLSIFITNKNGYPVLSKLHQDYIKFLFNYKIEVIFYDDSDVLINNSMISNSNKKISYDLSTFNKIKDYCLYICHLFKNHREFKNEDYIVFNYLDTFQIPLQPLRDNLQSQTYECFEEDNTKYDYYEMALNKALKNFKEKGFLNLKNEKNLETENNSKISRVLTACVLGGGRGPLVRKVVQSALSNNFTLGKNFKIYCVEKNRNAFNTLLNLKLKEPEIFGHVNFIFSDMRNFHPVEKLDIVVSELLGSFGDNELSPECLLDVQKYLSEDSIMIPHSYTSFVRPVMCPVVWANVRK